MEEDRALSVARDVADATAKDAALVALIDAYNRVNAGRPFNRDKLAWDAVLPLVSHSCLVDCRAAAPDDYTIVFRGESWPLAPRFGKGIRFGDIRSRAIRDMVTRDYSVAKLRQRPCYHAVLLLIGEHRSSHARLLLPFSRDDGRTVCELLSLTQPMTFPELEASVAPKTADFWDALPADPYGF